MGPYYLTALVQTFGSIAQGGRRRLQGQGSPRHRLRPEGRARNSPSRSPPTSAPWPSSRAASPRTASSASSRRACGWDSWRSPAQRPPSRSRTPTSSTAPSRLWRAGDEDWTTIPATGPANGRGMGVLDMARSIRAGSPAPRHRQPRLPRSGHHGLDLRVHGIGNLRGRRKLRPRVRSPPRGLGPHRTHTLGTVQ